MAVLLSTNLITLNVMKHLLFSSLVLTLTSPLNALPTVGPDYQRPETTAPSAYRDASSSPAQAALPEAWWNSLGDPALDALETRALASNQNLRAALARIEQARAVAGVARSSYLPALSLDPSVTRERTSRNTPNVLPNATGTTWRLPLDLKWELDLFGRNRRLNEGAKAELEAAGAGFEAARLSLTAEVASTYFTLRSLDQEIRIVNETTGFRRDALKLAQARFKRGLDAELDVVRAETELATTEAEASALALRQSSIRNAIAVLLGEPAPAFSLAETVAFPTEIPGVPAGLPGDLLTRRPDIAVAERALAAANARIGLAKAAFFPTISLTGSTGFASADLGDLLKSDSRAWSIGPSVYLPLFQGGRNRANLDRSKAAYEETLAAYNQSVLTAFQEVQDSLSASRFLGEQGSALQRAVASARRGAVLSRKRHDAGFVSYLEVVDAERTALEVERSQVRLQGQRWLTHISLIKALGGGWKQPAS